MHPFISMHRLSFASYSEISRLVNRDQTESGGHTFPEQILRAYCVAHSVLDTLNSPTTEILAGSLELMVQTESHP